MAPGGCCSGGDEVNVIDFTQGDDWASSVTVYDDSGAAADLTGFTAEAQIRRDVADLDPEVAAEITTEIVLPNIIVLSLLHGVTALLSGNYVWDLELTSPNGAVQTILSGTVVVTPEVTRPAGLVLQYSEI